MCYILSEMLQLCCNSQSVIIILTFPLFLLSYFLGRYEYVVRYIKDSCCVCLLFVYCIFSDTIVFVVAVYGKWITIAHGSTIALVKTIRNILYFLL